MARKLGKAATPGTKRKAAPAHPGVDEAAVMHPDSVGCIAGRVVVIEEYRHKNGQRARARGLPFSQALEAQIKSGSAVTEDILDVMALHAELVNELVLDAMPDANAGSTAEEKAEARAQWLRWIEGLDYAAGEQLLLRWWDVCGLFFLRPIVRRIDQALRVDAILVKSASDGATSMPASPPPGTATPSTSGASTPTAN